MERQAMDYVILEAQMEASAKLRNAGTAMMDAMQAQRVVAALLEKAAMEKRREQRTQANASDR